MADQQKVQKLFVVSARIHVGDDPMVIDALARAVTSSPHITLIDIHPNKGMKRCSFLFGGTSAALLGAAREMAVTVKQRLVKGLSPNAIDVLGILEMVSFIPLRSANLPEAAKLAREFGQTVGAELSVPVYLFGAAARRKRRRDLHNFNELSLADLPEQMGRNKWQPDCGPADLSANLGVSLVGARRYQLNFAAYFSTSEFEHVLSIAENHNLMARSSRKRNSGENFPHPALQSLSMVPEVVGAGREVRMVCNISNYDEVSLEQAIGFLNDEAGNRGFEVYGSQVLGYVPLESLLKGVDQIGRQGRGKSTGDADALIREVVKRLRLDAIEPFQAGRQVLEKHFEENR